MNNILILGGMGFIGSNLALNLLKEGFDITVMDNLSEQIHGRSPLKMSYSYNLIKDKVKFIRGSILDVAKMKSAIRGQDAIIHLAAETGTGQSMYQIKNYSEVNILGTSILLDVLGNYDHKVKKVVVASSRAIYGEGKYITKNGYIVYPEGRNVEDMEKKYFDPIFESEQIKSILTDEDSKIHPNSVYGITKQVQEQLIMKVCPALGIAASSLRYQNVYGPGQSLNNPYTGIISIFSNLILQKKELNIFEDGKESRDFVYINDIVNATSLVLKMEEANNKIYNVGSGVYTTVLEIAEILHEVFLLKPMFKISGNFRIGDIRHNAADISKIQNELNFIPQYSIKEGLKLFGDWVKTQSIVDNNYENSISELVKRGLLK